MPPLDPQRELAPVAPIGRMQVFVYARKDLPADSIDDVLAMIRSSPGRVSCGSAGGITRLAAEQLDRMPPWREALAEYLARPYFHNMFAQYRKVA